MYQKNPGPIVTYKNESEIRDYLGAHKLHKKLDFAISEVSAVVPDLALQLDLVTDPDGDQFLFLSPLFTGSVSEAGALLDRLIALNISWPYDVQSLIHCSVEFA